MKAILFLTCLTLLFLQSNSATAADWNAWTSPNWVNLTSTPWTPPVSTVYNRFQNSELFFKVVDEVKFQYAYANKTTGAIVLYCGAESYFNDADQLCYRNPHYWDLTVYDPVCSPKPESTQTCLPIPNVECCWKTTNLHLTEPIYHVNLSN